MTPALELCHVTKYYGRFKAVDDVSFSLAPGSICGFLGPNGAGKTTTLRMILEIIRPTSGQMSVLGHASALAVRQRLGYLPEEKGLYKKMKTWAVIAYFASLKGLSRKQAKGRAYELLERYGLKEFADKPTEALSKGMGQKVQVLASVAHDPELVILDEPFSGLDPVNQQVMEDIIYDLARRNRTVLFSTHVMAHAERLCERIILLARGRKIFDGTIAGAKRLLPRRVRLETADDIAPLRKLSQVVGVRAVGPAPGSAKDTGAAPGRRTADDVAPAGSRNAGEAAGVREGNRPQGSVDWELELREGADAQSILEACFDHRIRLHSFNQFEPALHDVFVRLVGTGAKEVGAR